MSERRAVERQGSGGGARRTGGRAESRAEADLSQTGAMGKALSILEIVAAAREPLSMSEIVRLSGLTKPTAHRITGALAEMGFIERDLTRRGYVEGPRLIRLALETLSAAAPRSQRHAILRSIAEMVGETCNFGVLSGCEVIYLDRVQAKWPLGLRFEAGSRVPAHCTANGKLLLSLLPERERERIVASMPLTRYTSRTITDQKRLLEAIARTAETRVGTDDQEFIDGVVCVSVPVITESGLVVGGIAVSAPEARVSLTDLLRFVPDMKKAASRLAATF